MKVVIAGGTGFIGKSLIMQLLAAGDSVLLLTRSGKIPKDLQEKAVMPVAPEAQRQNINLPEAQRQKMSPEVQRLISIQWDGKTAGDWEKIIDGADAVINLCGEGIARKRWSKKQKALLRSSRIDATRAIVRAIRLATVKPKVLANASAVGFYGNSADEVDEKYPQGKGFLSTLCADWEASAREVENMGVRLVLLRMGIVLGQGQGALQKMLPPFRFFFGGPLGTGSQWFPWIHVRDAVSLILFSVKKESLSGPVNVCAPYPVRMKEFCAALGRVLNRPSWLSVPPFVLKLILGEMAGMILEGQKTVPRKALQNGFKFRYSFLESALISILNPSF